MNDLFSSLGIEHAKPVLTALLLPPVPLLLLMLVGAWWSATRRGLGLTLVVIGAAAIWLAGTVGAGEFLQRALMAPSALPATELARIKREVAAGKPVAVLVLGGGRELLAPEYGVSNLPPLALERLRYGAWLAGGTGAPLAYAGGVGHAEQEGPSEAEVAARIAATQFGRPLRWREDQSRDTRENAARATALLRAAGVREVLLVTHGWHMPRALRAFKEAAARDPALRITPAAMGLAQPAMRPALRWIPSGDGHALVRHVMREQLGLWLGA